MRIRRPHPATASLAAACLLAAAAGLMPVSAAAQFDLSTVPDQVVLTPDGSAVSCHVVAQGPTGPAFSVLVELEFSPEADRIISWAQGQTHPLLTAYTNLHGEASFTIAGGGCILPDSFVGASYIAEVRFNGIPMKELVIVSPDAVNSSGQAGVSTCEDGKAVVGLADAIYHTRSISLGLSKTCSNVVTPYDKPVGLSDAVFLTPYIKQSRFCYCQ
jgi:hypothetical protein